MGATEIERQHRYGVTAQSERQGTDELDDLDEHPVVLRL